ncbi:MAG TPA: hypothetical protein VGS28_02915 [Candidatus Saccharimonadales bacterium]|nr:hypothetical protein [Candidatus Saccharimonadales bacterium]
MTHSLRGGPDNIAATRFIASPEGFALLERREALLEAVARFSLRAPGDHPEDAFHPNQFPGWRHVYTGALTDVMAFDGVDVAASTYTTGRVRWQQGYPTTRTFRMPRWDLLYGRAHPATDMESLIQSLPSTRQRRDPRVDLIDQSLCLAALGRELGNSEREELFVPRQWFALETSGGDTLAASRNIPGWLTLSQWLTLHGRPEHNALGVQFDADRVIREAAAKVRAAVGKSALRNGLGNLLDGDGRYFGDTMIVPEDISSPRDSRLGVVRLTSGRHHRIKGRAMGAARGELSGEQIITHPPIRELAPLI